MKIALNEIWNFLELIGPNEEGWEYKLVAGEEEVNEISTATMFNLKNDENYDTELLPSIFTFREILWQPDVFTKASMSQPSLRILRAYCEETALKLLENQQEVSKTYAALVSGLGKCCDSALDTFESAEKPEAKLVLGNFRKHAFPIVKFFIYHPKNRIDYFNDAVNRLNYAVKIMLTQFHGRYTELADPYWEVKYTGLKPENGLASNER